MCVESIKSADTQNQMTQNPIRAKKSSQVTFALTKYHTSLFHSTANLFFKCCFLIAFSLQNTEESAESLGQRQKWGQACPSQTSSLNK